MLRPPRMITSFLRPVGFVRQLYRARIGAKARRASCRCDGILPLCGSFGSEDPQCGSGDEVALKVEGVVNRTVHAEKALGGSSRLEPLQLALASSDCLMRILRPIVLPKPLLMPAGQSQTPERRSVGAQLVGDQQFRRETLLLEQFAHQTQRGPTVASTLNQHVENLALVVDGTPEIHPLAADAHHHLVQMPAIARPRATLAQPSRDRGTELHHPAPHR